MLAKGDKTFMVFKPSPSIVASDKKEYVRRAYATTSKDYDRIYGEEQYAKYFVGLRSVKPFGIVLDAGCGTGLLFTYILENELYHKISYYVGIDISPHMLSKALQRIRTAPYVLSDLVEADIEYTPFRQKSFDVIYSFTVVDLLEEPDKGVNELRGVCRYSMVISYLKKAQLARKKFPVARLLGETDKDIVLGIECCVSKS